MKFEEENDPLLVRWQYGLGRSAVFASDATARWATNWLDWPGFDLFWSNLVRDLLPRVPRIEARTHYAAAAGEFSHRISHSRATTFGGTARTGRVVRPGPG